MDTKKLVFEDTPTNFPTNIYMKRSNVRRPRRKANRRPRRKAPVNSVAAMRADNLAKLSTTIETIPIVPNTMYQFNHTLGASSRASLVAESYQYYKLDYVEVTIKPLRDTYIDVSGAGLSSAPAPQLYFYKNQTDSSPATLTQLKLMGVNPTSFARDGNKVFRYKPCMILGGYNPTAGFTAPQGWVKKASPWLATSKSSTTFVIDDTPHFGAVFYIDQTGGTSRVANCEVETHFKFKNPSLQSTPADNIVTPTRLSV